MAHIADLMVDSTSSSLGLNNYIAREISPSPPQPAPQDAASEVPPSDEREKYVWRMNQPSESRKYQLFPAKDKLSISAGRKSPESETTSSQPTAPAGSGEKEPRSILGAALALRGRPKEPNLIRRRKVSVPELGPMTTVQEVAMDSPTIPGRPPLHERSISAPGNSWRQHVFGESILSCISGPALDENAEMAILEAGNEQGQASSSGEVQHQSSSRRAGSASPKQPLSPKSLTPLVIPSSSAPQPQRLIRRPSGSRLRPESDGTPPEVPPKSARMFETSPYARGSPYTPMSASTTSLPTAASNTPLSSVPSTFATSVSNTPLSAPEENSSPKPWTTTSAGPSPRAPSKGHNRGKSESHKQAGQNLGHRRGESETSIMDRGRPKKRPDASPIQRLPSKSNLQADSSPMKRMPSKNNLYLDMSAMKRMPSKNNLQSESNAMKRMPSKNNLQSDSSPMKHMPSKSSLHESSPMRRIPSDGSPISRIPSRNNLQSDSSPIKRSPSKRNLQSRSPTSEQVAEQKAFEFLPQGVRASDVNTLLPANEIETLRKQAIGQASRFEVLNSKAVESLSRELRGLDERCEYLRKTHRSLRSGRRNLHDRICSYLRSPRVARFSHESMLKQEEALSELDSSIDDWVSKLEQAENRRTRVRQKLLEHVAAALIMQPTTTMAQFIEQPERIQQRIPRGENTPPRSPVKSHSPQRLADPVKVTSPDPVDTRRATRAGVESIRIYADSDVYALLADVEDEINRMGDVAEGDKVQEREQQRERETLRARIMERERERDREREAERERNKDNAISAGITLNAVAFSGMPTRGYNTLRTYG